MGKRFFCVLFALLGFVVLGQQALAQGGDDLNRRFNQANENFSKGDFAKAIEEYQQLIAQEGFSAPVLFNLANSYAQIDQPGKAILNYERAALLAPGDADISGNLEKVKKENGLFTAEKSTLDTIFYLLSLQEYSFLLLAGLLSSTGLIWTAITFPLRKTTKIATALFSILITTCAIAGIFRHLQTVNPSIITASTAKILVSPFESSASVGSIQEGKKVFPRKQHNNYILIEEETGRKGWVQSSYMEPLLPPVQ